MIRKLLFPALAIALLGGCVSSGYYQYRGGPGDYYYGQPQVEYRDYGVPYGGIGYGYPGGVSGSISFGSGYPYGYYGYGGGYGYGGYYDPWGYYPRYPRVIVVRPRHGGDHHDHHDGHDDDDDDDTTGGVAGGHRLDEDGDRLPRWRDPAGGLHPARPAIGMGNPPPMPWRPMPQPPQPSRMNVPPPMPRMQRATDQSPAREDTHRDGHRKFTP